MSDLLNLTISEARDSLKAKKFSAKELVAAHVKAIENTRDLNAFCVETSDLALKQAGESDERFAKNEARPLEGIPVAIKDLFCTKGIKSQSGSKILDGFVPPYESTVSQNLLDNGAVFLGKTSMDEFAMGSSNLTAVYGPVKSPWKTNDGKEVVPGGSSGGSSTAVAARIAMGATGTDTGGSIRQPAAFTGIVGFKPTYGRCSRWGMIAFASSLDQAGPMTRSVRDAAIMLQSMASYDTKDMTSAKVAIPDFESALTGDIKGMKVGVPKEYQMDGTPKEIIDLWQQGADMMRDAGAEIVEVSLSTTKYALPCYYIIAPAEASSNLARYDGVRYGLRVCEDGDSLIDMYEKTRAEGFGEEVKRRIMIGTYVLSAGYYDAYYRKAQRVRTLISNDFKAAFEKCDVLLTPTTPSAAFGLNEKIKDPIQMYLNDIFTVPASMAGLPGISVPAGLNSEGLPLGLQLIGRAFDEESVFRVADVLEAQANFTAKPQLVADKQAA